MCAATCRHLGRSTAIACGHVTWQPQKQNVLHVAGLYMANYNLVIPTVTELCRKIAVPNAMVGIIIGCCDIATIPGTIGAPLLLLSFWFGKL